MGRGAARQAVRPGGALVALRPAQRAGQAQRRALHWLRLPAAARALARAGRRSVLGKVRLQRQAQLQRVVGSQVAQVARQQARRSLLLPLILQQQQLRGVAIQARRRGGRGGCARAERVLRVQAPRGCRPHPRRQRLCAHRGQAVHVHHHHPRPRRRRPGRKALQRRVAQGVGVEAVREHGVEGDIVPQHGVGGARGQHRRPVARGAHAHRGRHAALPALRQRQQLRQARSVQVRGQHGGGVLGGGSGGVGAGRAAARARQPRAGCAVCHRHVIVQQQRRVCPVEEWVVRVGGKARGVHARGRRPVGRRGRAGQRCGRSANGGGQRRGQGRKGRRRRRRRRRAQAAQRRRRRLRQAQRPGCRLRRLHQQQQRQQCQQLEKKTAAAGAGQRHGGAGGPPSPPPPTCGELVYFWDGATLEGKK